MQELLQLIHIAKKKGQRSIQLVNQNFRKKEVSKDNQLYEGILSGEFETDDHAAKVMFKADPGNRNYRNAKAKLKQKLLNHLYFLDYEKESYTLYEKTAYELRGLLHQCHILLQQECPDIALRLLPFAIKTAEEFEFSDLTMEGIDMCRQLVARQGKVNHYHELGTQYTKARRFHDTVLTCQELYHDCLVHFNKSVSAQHTVLPETPKHIETIKEHAEKHNSHRLRVMAAHLELTYNNLIHEFTKNIDLCTALEQDYLNVPNQQVKVNLDRCHISFEKLKAYLYAMQVQEGIQYAKSCQQNFKVGTEYWFNFMEHYFLLLMAGQHYKMAVELYRKVRTNKNFTQNTEAYKDRWHIYRVYLLYMYDSKLLRWGFDLEAFIESTPNYDRDHQGYSTATLIIQCLYFLSRGQTERVPHVLDQLESFSSTHLDKRHNYRNSIFIRMLNIIQEKNFNYQLIEEKGSTYFKKLLETQIPSHLCQDMEIIPYQFLWEHVLQILKTNKIYVHYDFYGRNAMSS